MIADATIHPLASRELEDAVVFYEQRTPGLGKRFLNAAATAIEQTLLYPSAAPRVGETVRRKTLKRFPYDLIYSLEGEAVVFLAVAHHKRSPRYWMARLSD